MKQITDNDVRIGNFTSSEIFNLMSVSKDKKSFGKPALTYIKEKNLERKLNRSLSNSSDSKPTLWGKCLEGRASELIGEDWELCSDKTISHKEYDFWHGSPDCIKANIVGDIKCPFTLLSFCEFSECQTIEQVVENHKDGEKYYWQLVSNSILTNSSHAELIIYCPYLSEIDDVKQRSVDIEFTRMKNEYAWIYHSQLNEIPYLNDFGYYKNIKRILWEVSQSDKDLLTEKVVAASKLLVTI